MAEKKEVILLAEHGWQGMRHCALDFAQKDYYVTILVKGRPEKEVREFISKKPHIRNIFIPTKIFSMSYPFILLYKKFLRDIQHVVYQTTKVEKFIKLLAFKEACKKIKDLEESPYYSFQ